MTCASRTMIPLEKSFAAWRKDPDYLKAYESVQPVAVTHRHHGLEAPRSGRIIYDLHTPPEHKEGHHRASSSTR